MTGSDDDLTALRAMTSELVDALTGAAGVDGARSTPCDEWTLADLVDHVTGGNWYTIRVLAGDSSDEALAAAMARFGDGSASASAAVRSTIDQLGAFEQAGVLDRSWPHVAGELPGRQLLRLRLHDLIVHTWDLNETCRPPASVPAALADWGRRELATPGSLMARHFDIPPVAGDRPVGDTSSATYLHHFGR